MKNKWKMLGSLLVLFVLLSTTALSKDTLNQTDNQTTTNVTKEVKAVECPKNWKDTCTVLNDLENQIANIESTPGPQGPQGEPGPMGPPGPKGETGPAGAQGPQGEQGPKGDTGNVGPIGPQGPAGVVGPQGPKGDTGAAGPQGPMGPQGDIGQTGLQGPKGDTGATGAIGPQGPKGDTGATGAIGPQGPKGDTGATGAIGPQGPKGDTGATGAIGPQGPTGPTLSLGNLVHVTPSSPGGIHPFTPGQYGTPDVDGILYIIRTSAGEETDYLDYAEYANPQLNPYFPIPGNKNSWVVIAMKKDDTIFIRNSGGLGSQGTFDRWFRPLA